MTTAPPIRRMVHITDTRGKRLLPLAECAEPNPGSIVLTEGISGTCWQRHFADGLWHSTRGGESRTWEDLLVRSRLVLVYEAEVRDTGQVDFLNLPAGPASGLGVRELDKITKAEHVHVGGICVKRRYGTRCEES